jgi:hypothetical protein
MSRVETIYRKQLAPPVDLPTCDIDRNQSSGAVGDGMDFGRASTSAALESQSIEPAQPLIEFRA